MKISIKIDDEEKVIEVPENYYDDDCCLAMSFINKDSEEVSIIIQKGHYSKGLPKRVHPYDFNFATGKCRAVFQCVEGDF
jgi:hypothetical protein